MPEITYADDAKITEETFQQHYAKAKSALDELMATFDDRMADQNAAVYSRLVQAVGSNYGHRLRHGFGITPPPDYKRVNASMEAIASQDNETALSAAHGLWPEDGEAIPGAIVATVRALLDRGGQGLRNVAVGANDTSFSGRVGYMRDGPARGEMTSLRSRYQDVDERLTKLATLLHSTFNRAFERQILRERERVQQARTDAERAHELLTYVEQVLGGLEAHPHLALRETVDALEALATSLAETVNAAPEAVEQPEQQEAA